MQPHSYIIFCVAMAMKPATHTPHASMAEAGLRVRGDTRAKFCYAAERNLSLGQQGSRGDT